ncbi:MAG: hypothetical protein B7Y99_07775 [Caulobacterales bacterium 32-69-10]|nr:MAG: hypothetical protein B7Y99_07775 [Caulobacterales bacterium 32-69-10]
MTRHGFIARLRDGLRGLPPGAADDIVADYEAHFAEATAAGRSESEVAQALGDPGRLARELRVEVGLKRWEEERNPSAAAGAIFAVLGLATFDILVLLPILLGAGGALFGFVVACIAVFFAGVWVFVGGLTGNLPDLGPTPLQGVFAGVGLMSGSVAVGALLLLLVVGLINALVWYGRLHYRLLKPAVEN